MLSMRLGPDRRLVATDAESPRPRPDEALIGVAASTVNRGELGLIDVRDEGWAPGQDVAGVVLKAAADGSGPKAGSRVVGLAEQGAWSEQVTVRASRLAVVPPEVPLETAAALPMAGLTALRTLRLLGSVTGRRVLITGASGGLGRIQVRLATLSGAEVIAVARSAEQVPGAATVVADPADSPFVHAALESVGGQALTGVIAKLLPASPIVVFGTSSGEPTPLTIYDFIGHENVTLHTYFSYAADHSKDPEDLAFLLQLTVTGALEPAVVERFALPKAAEAVERMRRGGTGGKIVLVSEPPDLAR
ncbi:MAG: zinc-binding dehydrogenase [Catenulispora sp.]|nr:zinc-binding dehydrogenase [Catenulispora sp.]